MDKNEKKSLALTLKTDEKGMVVTTNVEEQLAYANMMIASGMLPKAYTTSAQVVVASAYAVELGLPRGIVSLRQIAVINGTPSIYGDLPLSLVYNSGKLKAIEEFLFDSNFDEICFGNKNVGKEAYGACCRVMREGDSKYHESYFTMDDKKKAGLGGVWTKYPRDMLKYRARGRALKDRFPDVLNGVSIAEFDHAVMPSEISGAINIDYNSPEESELNERFTGMDEGGKDKAVKTTIVDGEIINYTDEIPSDVEIPEEINESKIIPEGEELSPLEQAMEIEVKKDDWDNISKDLPGEYVITDGMYKGKKIKDIPIDELLQYGEKLDAHIKVHGPTTKASELVKKIEEFTK